MKYNVNNKKQASNFVKKIKEKVQRRYGVGRENMYISHLEKSRHPDKWLPTLGPKERRKTSKKRRKNTQTMQKSAPKFWFEGL